MVVGCSRGRMAEGCDELQAPVSNASMMTAAIRLMPFRRFRARQSSTTAGAGARFADDVASLGEPVLRSVSEAVARRFILGRQGLWPGRRWEGTAGARAAVLACEHLQLDPLVIVARSHDLMLHSRVIGYEPSQFDALAYDDRLFFDWGGWLAVRSMEELPYWRTLMRRQRDHPRTRRVVEQHGDVVDAMRSLLAERGTLASRDFNAEERRPIVSYRGSKDSSLVLYYLWLIGDAMTHHRDGFERVYAPTAAVAPARLLSEAADGETDRFMARKAIAFAGIGKPGPLTPVLARPVPKAEELAIEGALMESGEIVPLAVDGWPGRHFVLASDVDFLEEIATGSVPAAWTPIDTTTEEEVTFLSPLDPVLERRRAKALFGFDYVWEIYKKAELVQYGRFVMPILWRDRLAGRLDLRTDRRTQTLVVNGVWLEDDADARSAQFRDALAAGVQRMLGFLGTERVDATAVADARLKRAISSVNPRRRAPRSTTT
jgi:uncharacterized protein